MYLKNPVHIFMPDWASKERVDLMKMYNAKVTLVSKAEGGFEAAIRKAKEYAKNNNAYFTNQFENENNVLAHYNITGKEIWNQMGGNIGGFVSNKKYMSTDLNKPIDLNSEFISNKIELLGYEFVYSES